MARTTGLEPATSGVTGRHSNRLSYVRPASRSAAMAAVYGEAPTLSSRRLKKVGRASAGAETGRPGRRPVGRGGDRRIRRAAHAKPCTRGTQARNPCARGPGPLTMPASGRLAQLVEHLVYTERVGGSSPSPPTMFSSTYGYTLKICCVPMYTPGRRLPLYRGMRAGPSALGY